MRYPPLVAVDLSPPPAVREGISLLLELIDTYNSMMVPASGKNPNFDPVISALLDPIIQVSFVYQLSGVPYKLPPYHYVETQLPKYHPRHYENIIGLMPFWQCHNFLWYFGNHTVNLNVMEAILPCLLNFVIELC